jgi:SAM-dependent methyltransferase
LAADPEPFAGAARLCADATRLPLADESFDLLFSQFALLWLDARAAVREIHRILQPGGMLVAVEPDYGGLIEHPAEIATRDIWLAAMERAGADPCIGRKLPGLLVAAGFEVRVDLLDRLVAPSAARFDLLEDLPLTAAEREILRQIRRTDAACQDHARVAHLPIFAVTATKQ